MSICGASQALKWPCVRCVLVCAACRTSCESCVKYLNGTVLDERPIRVDYDWGFVEGRQWGRGRSGGQVCSTNLLRT